MVTIAHISDPHVGSPFFVPNLMNRVIAELNELARDAVVCTGDLTNEGYRQEYKSWLAYRERIEAPVHTILGNHDARNVGYLHFEELIGPRTWGVDVEGVRIVGVDSSEPDLNEGQVGRGRYEWIRERFDVPAELKVFALHHHLLPIPGTGRGFTSLSPMSRRPPSSIWCRTRAYPFRKCAVTMTACAPGAAPRPEWPFSIRPCWTLGRLLHHPFG